MLACPCRLCLNLLISLSVCFSFLLSSHPHLPLSLAHYLILGFAFFSVGFRLRRCLSNVMRKMAPCSSMLNGLYRGSEASVHPASWRDSGSIWKLLLASTCSVSTEQARIQTYSCVLSYTEEWGGGGFRLLSRWTHQNHVGWTKNNSLQRQHVFTKTVQNSMSRSM